MITLPRWLSQYGSTIVSPAGSRIAQDLQRIGEESVRGGMIALTNSGLDLLTSPAQGDILVDLYVFVTTVLDGTRKIQLQDGNSTAVDLIPAGIIAVGLYPFRVNAACMATTTPGWKILYSGGSTGAASAWGTFRRAA